MSPQLPRPSASASLLAAARALARPLGIENEIRSTADPQLHAALIMQADQGEALRRVLAECTAAIVLAIRESHDG